MPQRLAYLASQYPAINHAFMLGEVRTLRTLGWEIATFSIRLPDRPPEQLSPEELDEYARTRYVKPASWSEIAACHGRRFLSGPASYLAGLVYALRLGRATPAELIRRVLYFGEAVVLGCWLRKGGYTHTHSHYSSTIALLVSRLFPVTFSMTVHGPHEFNDPRGFAMAEKIARARFSVAISHFAQSQMSVNSAPDFWDRIEVCYLGVPVPITFPRSAFQRRPGPVRLLSAGRLAPEKSLHTLVDAASLLRKGGAEFHLTIAGDGPLLAFLRRRLRDLDLEDCVSLPGFLAHEKLARLYQEADLFVLPSAAEGVPVVLMEAMSNGVPCVSTRITGVPELIEDGVSGLLVTPSDAGALAGALARLIESPSLRVQLGEGGWQRVRAQFDLTTNVSRLSGILERRLAG
jgi:colanic acid/amylovoran biosynthesis glycosyltransferase